MTADYSDKDVLVDDFIGGKKGTKVVKELLKYHSTALRDYIPLDIDFIRKAVIKKLGRKQYDLMIFIESGGVYFLGIPEITKHARETATIPASGHDNPLHYNTHKLVSELERQIKSSKKIAIVEGDVGVTSHSFGRLMRIRHDVWQLNEKADIDTIVGVSVAEFAHRFDIVGVLIRQMVKLSDIAHGLEDTLKDGSFLVELEKKLLTLWQHRKTLPVLKK